MKKLAKGELYNIYIGPCFADIQKEENAFRLLAAKLTAEEASTFHPANRRPGETVVISYASYAKNEEPAAYA